VIPALGYRSRTEAALALSKQGLSDPQIADKLGISRKNLGALLASAAAGARKPVGRTLTLSEATIERLRGHAVRRGVPPVELARRIVEAALDGNLVVAVLDDEVAA
jgi:hypothetical protein